MKMLFVNLLTRGWKKPNDHAEPKKVER